MPLPKPKDYDDKEEFIEDCMDDTVMKREFNNDRRIAVCERLWEER